MQHRWKLLLGLCEVLFCYVVMEQPACQTAIEVFVQSDSLTTKSSEIMEHM